MLRLALLVSAWALFNGDSQAGDFRDASTLRYRGVLPPPEVAYRDPAYLPPPPPPPPLPVVRVPRSLNLPLYNEPPRRF